MDLKYFTTKQPKGVNFMGNYMISKASGDKFDNIVFCSLSLGDDIICFRLLDKDYFFETAELLFEKDGNVDLKLLQNTINDGKIFVQEMDEQPTTDRNLGIMSWTEFVAEFSSNEFVKNEIQPKVMEKLEKIGPESTLYQKLNNYLESLESDDEKMTIDEFIGNAKGGLNYSIYDVLTKSHDYNDPLSFKDSKTVDEFIKMLCLRVIALEAENKFIPSPDDLD